VVDRHAGAHEGQRKQVTGDPEVAPDRREQCDDRQWVHADPLVPAELAGNEVRDLGEEEAAARRDRRDDEGRPQLVAPDRRTQGRQRPSQSHECSGSREEPQAGEHLARDAQRCQSDDHIVGHLVILTTTPRTLGARGRERRNPELPR
jgi:hypothetical protein